ncbi:AAA family ATPase [Pseudanabaena yagii]|uniref:ATP-binding protein n=1 Tax=Pseudanabaena yagii GIHE-NHR1 TaxID=2722753 RepID=A0ABX1LMG7_9CYAN|nr:ATP-binding protein [Pseudanabaena yagii]NMF57319.1 ATP-binding protein [Pseudanabaena yagii GIHE-NHR1]
MLSKLKVQHYKSLFDTEIDLEPLTVFIGPNGSGKSNICESLVVLSDFLNRLAGSINNAYNAKDFFSQSLQAVSKTQVNIESKFWHGNLDHLCFIVSALKKNETALSKLTDLFVSFAYPQQNILIKILENEIAKETSEASHTLSLSAFLVANNYQFSPIAEALRKICIYDFAPLNLSNQVSSNGSMARTGEGIAYALVDILLSNRKGFDELEERLKFLVPNIQKISLPRSSNQSFSLQLIDKYSEHHIPASDISDGTLRILAFLTALYQENTPSIICFEEIENGVHPWLLHKMMELLKLVSTEGITGKPVQVLITTHSPTLLNYVEPHQVRAVELDNEGKTQVHNLPTDSVRFQKALEAYDGSLGELWFTNQFGGNPA